MKPQKRSKSFLFLRVTSALVVTLAGPTGALTFGAFVTSSAFAEKKIAADPAYDVLYGQFRDNAPLGTEVYKVLTSLRHDPLTPVEVVKKLQLFGEDLRGMSLKPLALEAFLSLGSIYITEEAKEKDAPANRMIFSDFQAILRQGIAESPNPLETKRSLAKSLLSDDAQLEGLSPALGFLAEWYPELEPDTRIKAARGLSRESSLKGLKRKSIQEPLLRALLKDLREKGDLPAYASALLNGLKLDPSKTPWVAEECLQIVKDLSVNGTVLPDHQNSVAAAIRTWGQNSPPASELPLEIKALFKKQNPSLILRGLAYASVYVLKAPEARQKALSEIYGLTEEVDLAGTILDLIINEAGDLTAAMQKKMIEIGVHFEGFDYFNYLIFNSAASGKRTLNDPFVIELLHEGLNSPRPSIVADALGLLEQKLARRKNKSDTLSPRIALDVLSHTFSAVAEGSTTVSPSNLTSVLTELGLKAQTALSDDTAKEQDSKSFDLSNHRNWERIEQLISLASPQGIKGKELAKIRSPFIDLSKRVQETWKKRHEEHAKRRAKLGEK